MKQKMDLMVFVMAICAGCMISCGSDDNDDDNNQVSAEAKKLYGAWGSFVLMSEGKMLVTTTSNSNYSVGVDVRSWSYNGQTGILATNAYDSKGNNLQWQVTMIEEDSWAGIQLWNNSTGSFRITQDGLFYGVLALLGGFTWVPKESGAEKTFEINMVKDTQGRVYKLSSGTGKIYLRRDRSLEDIQSNDVIVFYDLFYNDDRKTDDTKFEIHHPYDYNKIYLQYPSGIKYYPKKQ